MRLLLHEYFHEHESPVDPNRLRYGAFAKRREWIDDWLGIESSDLAPETLDSYRPLLHRVFAQNCSDNPCIVKTHEKFRRLPNGEAIFPPECTAGVLLVVRNPLAIVPSLASQLGLSIDLVIDFLNDSQAILGEDKGSFWLSLPEPLGSWSEHTRSWLDSGLRVQIVKYEDLHRDPTSVLASVVQILKGDPDGAGLSRAVSSSRFERLAKWEERFGFSGGVPGGGPFFRSGKLEEWRETLNRDQISRVVSQHREMMIELGYENEYF